MVGLARRGFGLIGLVLLILIFAAVGLTISYFARHADRGSHWFQHSQLAHGLADAGLKQAIFLLSRANSAARAGQSGPALSAAKQVFDRLRAGGVGDQGIKLFSSDDTANLPPALRESYEKLAEIYSTELDVRVEVVASKPFWDGSQAGIPLMDGERQGVVRFTSHASVKAPVGVQVERTMILEKDFRVVSILPPVLGRFSLFLAPRGAPEPNIYSVRFDDTSGDGVSEGGSLIVLQNGYSGSMVDRGGTALNRSGFLGAIPDPKLMDKQGWVYLGPVEGGTAPWTLKLTHGYGPAGESELLEGDMRHVVFKGNQADDDGFRQRFDDAFEKNATEGCQSSLITDTQKNEGLEQFVHGWASNYELIGMDPINYEVVQQGGARIAPQLGDGQSSILRLFGTPDRFSPTLVFGPVMASTIRRAEIEARVGPEAFCASSGLFRLNLLNLPEHPPKFQTVLQAAFGADYPEWGTNTVEAPLMDALNIALSGDGDGNYGPDGILGRRSSGAAGGKLSSAYFPWVAQIGTDSGIPQDQMARVLDGRLDVAPLYSGPLSGALKAFQGAMMLKMTYVVKPDAFADRMLGGDDKKGLEVPGLVLLMEPGGRRTPVVLPPGLRVERGGILMTAGPLEIQGDITRTDASEPLTLVSLSGGITVGPAARKIDAHLISLRGGFDIQSSGLTISGGLATRHLDFTKVKAMAEPLTIQYAPETDPLGPNRDGSLRTYYGGADRLVVAGSMP